METGKPSQKLRDFGALEMSTTIVTKVKDLTNTKHRLIKPTQI